MKESFIGFTDKCRNLLDGTVDRGPTIAIIICMLCSVISTLFQILLKFYKLHYIPSSNQNLLNPNILKVD